ncbi:MAG: ribosome silencing factor [Pseudomonadota bacterium]
MNAEQLSTLVNEALADLKAQNVVSLDVAGMTSIADRIVIASGTSSRHVKSLADSVIERAKQQGVRPLGVEGDATAEWVLVDLGDVIVHVMTPATRQYYDLERLWSLGSADAAKAADARPPKTGRKDES